MQKREHLPDINRLSIVTATIMLAFALTRVISFPAQEIAFNLFGILLTFSFDFSTVISLLTAILAAVGTIWLIESHPGYTKAKLSWLTSRHWIVPVFSTLVIGVALNNFSGGSLWWVIFGVGNLILLTVLVAEYHVVSVSAIHHPLATVGLTALSFALYLLLAIAIFSTDMRLYLRLPVIAVGAFMVISRTFFLRLGTWNVTWSLVISLILSEVAIGFNYMPIRPIQFGLMMVGIAYALTSLVIGIQEKRQRAAFWVEPVGMLVVLLMLSMIWL